jgi:hypothetical protein
MTRSLRGRNQGIDFEVCLVPPNRHHGPKSNNRRSASSKSLGEFGRDVRAALKKLKELGLIEDFNAERGPVMIKKKTGTRT